MPARIFSTPFAERFGLRLPLVQAPMVGASTAAMVAAASNAGALGSLACGAFEPERLVAEVAAIRAATARAFAVNLFVLQPASPDAATVARALAAIDPLNAALGLPPGAAPVRYAPDFRAQLDALVALRVPVASFTFGVLDAADVARLKAAGTYVIGTATHVAEGLAWQAAGADALAAQGAEAGGHRGTFIGSADDALIGTFALVPQLVDATGLPVLAAGGIMDGRGIAAALALGAQAAQLGTAFLTCAESAIAADWKARVRASADTSTQVTRAITGRHARGLRNTLMARLGEHVAEVPPYPVQNALTQPLRQAAARANDGDYLSLWAGQGAPLTRRRDAALSAAQLVDALDAEWRAMAA
ncbi:MULTISPECIES: NAD(P)H-dependent flavin oxidoreductase [Burkholderia]|uniref:Nitronate monooxygenase n=2 Tax=Burkholderia vietnamiensis TaxID=60552 RepID=A0A132E2A9_BURVI|nr:MULTISPECIES: nitronate monooxygenase [Burkholderia]AJY05243.1 nitronate monooxygenase family protein [Burkholderia vietnamiensis LMG 10929]AOK01603.1 nitronate monooxygenase [Burkholderia vietnamiensis]AOK08930.1 nitronate monooxygenase [Burkholderia vietnamiensis]AOK42307.1 nitronate monooxygenase [Burkholderia vietnamiensis]AVR17789.1 nitronate monooxygenase [Burkholderia vietnamiensis]